MSDVKNLVSNIITACQEKKAKNIVTIDLSDFPGAICQYYVICEGSTPTQVSAIADEVVNYAKKTIKERPISTDGMTEGRWVGIDYGTVIVHVFIPELRQFYDIEHLWDDAKLEYIPNLD